MTRIIKHIVLAFAITATVFAQQDDPGSPRRLAQLTLLQINDVYSTVPINDVGGLARVATLKQRLSADKHPVLMLLAGDFLSPSVASSIFKGEQMVATLNAAGLDYATFGNHEFDFGIDVLKQRMAESTFTWVVSNVVDAKTGGAIGKAKPYVVRDIGGLKVGIIGLCITTAAIAPAWQGQFKFVDPVAAAVRYLPALSAKAPRSSSRSRISISRRIDRSRRSFRRSTSSSAGTSTSSPRRKAACSSARRDPTRSSPRESTSAGARDRRIR
jgi:2',3'-cyclic-nucleotide 2'-phosphodiesterase (5'-nucleotidase family)